MPHDRADDFEHVSDEVQARWTRFAAGDQLTFPSLVGLQVDEVRRGYCRMRLPFRPELKHAGGIVHGGAIVTLLDSAVVPAIGVSVEPGWSYSTVDLHVQFVGAVVDGDIVAEGWIVRQGRSTIFAESEARDAEGRLIARALLTFAVRPPR